mgnify:FL=1
MNYILFDNNRDNFLPLTYTRSVSDIRIGILTIYEKWKFFLGTDLSVKTIDYLQPKYNLLIKSDNIFINSSVLPSNELIDSINKLNDSEAIFFNNTIIAYRNNPNKKIEFNKPIVYISELWHIFRFNSQCIKDDFKLITNNKTSQKLSDTNRFINKENIFVENGAKVEHCILNASDGPIYIGKDSEIMEGSMIRGPFALCNNSIIKMGAKIYGGTTFGPHCKVGGEVNNSVLLGFSNKSHDGFLGNSIIGEWCNLGADTNTSNLKNNYASVKIWSEKENSFIDTGLQFFGLIMGDHSKTSINTMFNTGTIIGSCVNIFGSGFPRNFVPSFSWGGSSGYSSYQLEKFYDVAKKVMLRRNITFSSIDKEIYKNIFDITLFQRKY